MNNLKFINLIKNSPKNTQQYYYLVYWCHVVVTETTLQSIDSLACHTKDFEDSVY